jgi:pyruvate/2-oxoglutarate dehydrogenase complex dihydrolipoamide dehydrogenase (E3) component
MPGLDPVNYSTSDSLLDIDFLPRHLIVVGGGYIGLEFGKCTGTSAARSRSSKPERA